jgi:hypothetical protein
MSEEYEFEPVPGLPEQLPENETIVWQGAPEWRGIARRVFHAGAISAYFALLAAWAFASVLYDGGSAAAATGSALRVGVACAITLLLIAWLARATARATLYTITTKRVAMRFGIAVPMTVNLPFSRIAAADMRPYGDGTGEIALQIEGPLPLAYWHLWPHCRPWRLAKAAPMLRCVSEPQKVADILAAAVAATGKTRLKQAEAAAPHATTDAGTPGLVAA